MAVGKAGFHNRQDSPSGLKNGKLGCLPPFRPAAQPPKQPQPNTTSMRGSVVRNTSRNPHEVEVVGSNPTPASKNPRSNSPLTCPECGSISLYKDGIRYLNDGSQAQRFLCRNCGYRFSNGNGKSFKRSYVNTNNCQVCELDRGSKNLAAIETKTVAGEIGKTFDKATAKGLLLQYELWLQKEGYGENCRYVSCIRMLINSGTNLLNPDDVKAAIAKKKWKNGTKMQATYAYDALARMLNITWSMPTYKQEEILPFIPDEKELDALICGARSRRLAAYLQTLKETFADPSEALRLRWIDITENIVTINRPVKNHNPRQLQVSNKLLAMVNALPKDSQLIFPTTYNNMALCFYKVRRKIAQTQQNPRIMNISLGTFRHWGATMVYHQTRDILLVKKLLGHKKIENTMKYTQLIQFKDSEYDIATATTVEEAKTLLAAGFEQQPVPINGVVLFRKPKRFNC